MTNFFENEVTKSNKRNARPGLLSFFLVLAIVLGSGGTVTSLISIRQAMQTRDEAVAAADPQNSFMGKLTGQDKNEEFVKFQRDMAGALYDELAPVKPISTVLGFLNFVLSVLLIVFSIAIFKRKDLGRRVLSLVAFCSLPFEWCRFLNLYAVADVTSKAMVKWMPKIQEAQGDTTLSSGFSDTIGSASYYFMTVSYALMALGFTALYLWLGLYLRGEKAKAFTNR